VSVKKPELPKAFRAAPLQVRPEPFSDVQAYRRETNEFSDVATCPARRCYLILRCGFDRSVFRASCSILKGSVADFSVG